MSKSTTENQIEQYNLQLLQALGYSYKNGYNIQPEAATPKERRIYDESLTRTIEATTKSPRLQD